MNTRTIALDMDGVLADMLPWMLYLLNRYHNEKLKVDDINEWEIHKACKNATAEQVYAYFEEPGFFRHLMPMPGALEAVRTLIANGYQIIIITAAKNGHADKLYWMKNHLPEVQHNDIYFAKHKERIPADVFVDDCIENLERYKKANPKSLVICMDAPYNRKFAGVRANNWTEVLQWIAVYEEFRYDEALVQAAAEGRSDVQ